MSILVYQSLNRKKILVAGVEKRRTRIERERKEEEERKEEREAKERKEEEEQKVFPVPASQQVAQECGQVTL